MKINTIHELKQLCRNAGSQDAAHAAFQRAWLSVAVRDHYNKAYRKSAPDADTAFGKLYEEVVG